MKPFSRQRPESMQVDYWKAGGTDGYAEFTAAAAAKNLADKYFWLSRKRGRALARRKGRSSQEEFLQEQKVDWGQRRGEVH